MRRLCRRTVPPRGGICNALSQATACATGRDTKAGAAAAAPRYQGLMADAPTPHILVVDDHREIRDAVTKYLARNGMRAGAAKSAAEMDAARRKGRYDLVVLDVMMPGARRGCRPRAASPPKAARPP
jgi:hypothetical protein